MGRKRGIIEVETLIFEKTTDTVTLMESDYI